ncbi:glycosyltransferase family 2 protein [Candidatus Thioglobus sp.]|nr:glycosyltransferase family 2 protein [Candidatus Thioglobus sp.]
MKFSVIIPCFNEAQSIQKLVEMLVPLQIEYDLEYIFVENGSLDKSKEFFQKNIEKKFKNLKVVYVKSNIGYGYGLQRGLEVASGDYVGWAHADSQVMIDDLRLFFAFILHKNNNREVLLKGKRNKRGLFDLFFTTGQGLFNTILFGKWLFDVGASPVLFSKNLIKNIDDMPNDFSIELYTYIEAIKKRLIIVRLNVDVSDRKIGASSWNNGIVSKLKQSKKIFYSSVKIRIGRKVL